MYTTPCLLMWDFIIHEKYSYVYISFVKKGLCHLISLKAIELRRNTDNLNCKVTTNQSIILQTYTLLLQIYIAVEKNAAFGS